MIPIQRSAIALSACLLLAACGGGTSGTTGPGPGEPTASAPTSEASQPTPTDPASTAGPDATPGGPGEATGNPTVAGVCDLVTVAEMEALLGGPITLNVVPGPPDTCDIERDSAPSVAIVMTTGNGRMIYDVLAAGDDAQPVSGVGDAAFYSDQTQLLVVAKGTTMLSIAVTDDAIGDSDRLDILRQVGAAAASRL